MVAVPLSVASVPPSVVAEDDQAVADELRHRDLLASLLLLQKLHRRCFDIHPRHHQNKKTNYVGQTLGIVANRAKL